MQDYWSIQDFVDATVGSNIFIYTFKLED